MLGFVVQHVSVADQKQLQLPERMSMTTAPLALLGLLTGGVEQPAGGGGDLRIVDFAKSTHGFAIFYPDFACMGVEQ